MQKHHLDLSKLSGIVTDGAPSVIGLKIGKPTLSSEHMQDHEEILSEAMITYNNDIH